MYGEAIRHLREMYSMGLKPDARSFAAGASDAVRRPRQASSRPGNTSGIGAPKILRHVTHVM